MSHTVILNAGDHVGDGHKRTSAFIIDANYPASEIKLAYNAAIQQGYPDIVSCCFTSKTQRQLCAQTAEELVARLLKEPYKVNASHLIRILSITDGRSRKRIKQMCTDYTLDLESIQHRKAETEDLAVLYLLVAKSQLQDLLWDKAYPGNIYIGGYHLV